MADQPPPWFIPLATLVVAVWFVCACYCVLAGMLKLERWMRHETGRDADTHTPPDK
jgi:threonine/homoserine/homoserine lactone efflux protein